MDELLEQFLIERRELVEQAADDLIALEAQPDDRALVDSAFRAIHTLKGSTGLFDMAPATDGLHAAEDLLSQVRDGHAEASFEVIESLLAAVNQVDRWIDDFEASGALPADAARVSRELRVRLVAATGVVNEGAQTVSANQDQAWVVELAPSAPEGSRTVARYTPSVDCFFRGDDPLAVARGVPGLLRLDLASREPWGDPDLFDPFRCNLVIILFSDAPRNEVETAFRLVFDQVEIAELSGTAPSPESMGEARAASSGAERTVRIDAARLDALAEIVDELMVAKNAAAHLAALAEGGLDPQALRRGLAAHAAEFDRLTGRLHRTVMRTRMAPLAGLWRRFPRLVREIASAQGKTVDFRLSGDGVEVDKSLLDGLFEPLIHLIRNGLDHGIESAAERETTGKPARASLTLSARQAGDLVVIEVADDGRGIDPDAMRRNARQRGLLDEDALEALDDQGAIELIFLSGFSTAREVSDLSGRGVGMDAVRSAVTRMGGTLAIESARGAGTRVSLTLPLAMVLTKVMVVKAGGERFGVPMDGISETARIDPSRIAEVREGRAFVLRDRTVPLFDLAALTGAEAAPEAGDLTVLVFRHGEGLAAVSVDGVVDRIDIVMRPLSGLLTHMPGVSGATLMGDGEVLMLLDLEEMVG